MFASLGSQARGTMNTLTKRNVDFDRAAPGEEDLEQVHTVALGEFKGAEDSATRISGYLLDDLSESGRFSLLDEAPSKKKAEPGTATLVGKIREAEYSEREESQEAKCNDKPCTVRTRIGEAVVAVNFSLVDAKTGKVLVQKTFEDRREEKTTATDGSPPSIDGDTLLDEASRKVAADFFAVVSPHVVSETVYFETDGKAKALKEGANRAMNGDLDGAVASFEEGLTQAQTRGDAGALAKARFDLGLALVISGDYERGVELLELAQSPKPKKGWAETLDAARAWQSDAERAQAQWAMGESGERELDPALRPSEGASETGKKMLELTGVKLSRAK